MNIAQTIISFRRRYLCAAIAVFIVLASVVIHESDSHASTPDIVDQISFKLKKGDVLYYYFDAMSGGPGDYEPVEMFVYINGRQFAGPAYTAQNNGEVLTVTAKMKVRVFDGPDPENIHYETIALKLPTDGGEPYQNNAIWGTFIEAGQMVYLRANTPTGEEIGATCYLGLAIAEISVWATYEPYERFIDTTPGANYPEVQFVVLAANLHVNGEDHLYTGDGEYKLKLELSLGTSAPFEIIDTDINLFRSDEAHLDMRSYDWGLFKTLGYDGLEKLMASLKTGKNGLNAPCNTIEVDLSRGSAVIAIKNWCHKKEASWAGLSWDVTESPEGYKPARYNENNVLMELNAFGWKLKRENVPTGEEGRFSPDPGKFVLCNSDDKSLGAYDNIGQILVNAESHYWDNDLWPKAQDGPGWITVAAAEICNNPGENKDVFDCVRSIKICDFDNATACVDRDAPWEIVFSDNSRLAGPLRLNRNGVESGYGFISNSWRDSTLFHEALHCYSMLPGQGVRNSDNDGLYVSSNNALNPYFILSYDDKSRGFVDLDINYRDPLMWVLRGKSGDDHGNISFLMYFVAKIDLGDDLLDAVVYGRGSGKKIHSGIPNDFPAEKIKPEVLAAVLHNPANDAVQRLTGPGGIFCDGFITEETERRVEVSKYGYYSPVSVNLRINPYKLAKWTTWTDCVKVYAKIMQGWEMYAISQVEAIREKEPILADEFDAEYFGTMSRRKRTSGTCAADYKSTDDIVVYDKLPVELEQEQLIMDISNSSNECDILKYLQGDSSAVMQAVCRRLSRIGSGYSLGALENIITNSGQDLVVREEAAEAFWNIKYRMADPGSKEYVLLDVLEVYKTDTETGKRVRDGSGAAKTARVIDWAMELLGDMGSQQAVPMLTDFVNDNGDFTPSQAYLKEKAKKALDKIKFLKSYPDVDEAIRIGFVRGSTYIRKLALKLLVKQNPPDIIERLNDKLKIYGKTDTGLRLAISAALEEKKEEVKYMPLEIICPTDGDIFKTPVASVYGTNYGEPFFDAIELEKGENTYTKTITAKDGTMVSKSVKVYFQNDVPILDPIGNKTVKMGEALSFLVSAKDDGVDSRYFAYVLPPGAMFDYDTGAFSWTPGQEDIGVHEIMFMVDDGYGLTDTETVTINVCNANGIGVRHTVCADVDGDGKSEYVVDAGPGFGIYVSLDDGQWRHICGIGSRNLIKAELNGNSRDDLVIDFGPEYGVWILYDNDTSNWTRLCAASVESILAADLDTDSRDELILDAGPGYGSYIKYNNDISGPWSQFVPVSAKSMIKARLEDGLQDDIVADFGSVYGIYVCHNAGSDQAVWEQICSVSSESMLSARLDNDARDDLVIDFGDEYGVYVMKNRDNGIWSQIVSISPENMIRAKMNGNGQDELVMDFGGELGIWVLYDLDGSTWTNLCRSKACSMVSCDINGNGMEEVFVDFGPDIGGWLFEDDIAGIWHKVF